MENEKILEKIKKLFELSKNNPSQEEAKSAALKAQELLAQYHIDAAEVENIDLDKIEEIEEIRVDIPAKKWKYSLARIIADNFRCKHFYCGKDTLIFYGHKTDAQVAAETFKHLFKMGNMLGNRLYREAKENYERTENVYNSCVTGFCAGIRDALAEQSKALMVIVPEDVKDKYKDRSAGFKSFHTSGVYSSSAKAYARGHEAGYNAMRRNALEG